MICRDLITVTTPTDGHGQVTLADLVNFRPVAAVEHAEPNGWTVIGLDTNFYLDTGSHVQNNLLLGVPASVRFTPVGFRWSYGDGASATTASGGASWAALGLREFDRTPTSHVYPSAGRYVVGVAVDFRAEYTFGAAPGAAPGSAAWVPIAGTVPVASAPIAITAGDADTVLVERDCSVARSGPGC